MKKFVKDDLFEVVILLTDKIFYKTTAPGNIAINKAKKHKGKILLINASKEFAKGRPRNYLTKNNLEKILDIYSEWKELEGFSKIIGNEKAKKMTII